MRDVAALAGVSVKTVSRVVNDEPSVSPDVATRVREAVSTLGYRHDLAASNLRRSVRRGERREDRHDPGCSNGREMRVGDTEREAGAAQPRRDMPAEGGNHAHPSRAGGNDEPV